ncbi:TRAP transporter large permease [Litchfieldella xinjiangensis]|uniref:TRAP transporter large permease n=1 Tax=Litchfieldella xinjiangensis TaxID=1166948 RepID=UPI00069326B7|nr:TRAP transporter large permease [Halomonas xinjiangensis]
MMLLLLLSAFVLLLLRAPIFFALGAPALAYLSLKGFPLGIAPQRMIGTVNNSILLAVPMFLLAGRIMNIIGATERIFNFADALIGHVRGGLGYVSVVASIIFSAMSGSAAADAVGVGTMTVKAMRERGYDPNFAAAVTLSSATLSPIIPPSIIMIVYGATANVSIGAMFLGGILPGLFIAAGLMIAVGVLSSRRDYPKGRPPTWPRLWKSFKDAIFVLFTPVIIIGGIFGGVFTATEAGVVAVVYVMLLGFIYRTLHFAELFKEVVAAATSVGVLLFIVAISGLDTWVITREQLPASLAGLVTGLVQDPTLIIILILLVVLFLGMFLDATPIILMVVPAIMPLITTAGIDPLHLGVLFSIVCVIGLITPPVGVALYGVAMVANLSIERVFWATLPFFAALLLTITLFIFVPEIITTLPYYFR